ncbi:MAG: Transcription antitermination protein NusB [Chlamydiia bacterium]|nr:Transcription antitermination protein NusB [Chlamydiia bacterium]MCH9615438.1 Transcription antitermination protein NusB [Chlamydiia bacterium]MCH9628240.1 Transcription antitermination protein NusB [Chlamydiia bacterium]
MKFPIRKFRELVLQLTYAKAVSSSLENDFSEFFKKEKEVLPLAEKRSNDILAFKSKLDELIRESSDEYQFERIGEIEKNILRLGLYEIMYDEEVPKNVAISEAVRLMRKYGTREGGAFVNAILDKTQKAALK